MPYLDQYDVTSNGQVFNLDTAGDFEFNIVASSNSFQQGQFVLTTWFERDPSSFEALMHSQSSDSE